MALPVLLVGSYTYLKPDFESNGNSSLVWHWLFLLAGIVGICLGFQDGFFGPGTGSFLFFALVRLFGMDTLHASASGKDC